MSIFTFSVLAVSTNACAYVTCHSGCKWISGSSRTSMSSSETIPFSIRKRIIANAFTPIEALPAWIGFFTFSSVLITKPDGDGARTAWNALSNTDNTSCIFSCATTAPAKSSYISDRRSSIRLSIASISSSLYLGPHDEDSLLLCATEMLSIREGSSRM